MCSSQCGRFRIWQMPFLKTLNGYLYYWTRGKRTYQNSSKCCAFPESGEQCLMVFHAVLNQTSGESNWAAELSAPEPTERALKTWRQASEDPSCEKRKTEEKGERHSARKSPLLLSPIACHDWNFNRLFLLALVEIFIQRFEMKTSHLGGHLSEAAPGGAWKAIIRWQSNICISMF